MRNYHSAFNHIIEYVSVHPFLYRYEDEIHIDSFFEKGELMLSSFFNYKKYDDNSLGDKDEGNSFNIGQSNDGLSISTFVTTGFDDYTFCTSTILDRKLLSDFKRNHVFRIKDPINFILEITRSLTRVQQVLHGNCIYLDQRMLRKDVGDVTMDTLKAKEGGVSFEKMMAISNYVSGYDQYFIKLTKYQVQNEYRIIWKTDRKVTDKFKVDCPEAVKFCERISPTAF